MADSDLADLRKSCITSLYLCTDNISKYLDSEKEAEFNKLKSYVDQYCLMEAQQNVTIRAVELIKEETDASNINSLNDRLTSKIKSMMDQDQEIVENHPFRSEFERRVRNGLQAVNEDMDESDLAITATPETFIDPSTKKQIVDPVRNTICKHVYEREAILNHIKMRKEAKCPVVGCRNKNPIQKDHLQADEELRLRLTLTQRSTAVQEQCAMDDSQEL